VRINSANVSSVLGADATVESAQDFIRKALGGNSLSTLELAKAHAENESIGSGCASS
jgi:aromatase